jgi:signal transduction histidine kinase
VDDVTRETPGFTDAGSSEKAEIMVEGQVRGRVEVTYPPENTQEPEGPFRGEHRRFLEVIAREVALMIQTRIAREEKLELMDQLRHADRLATIGELAAGVAHEINEPLSEILGFAQLCQKIEGLPEQAVRDLDKIRDASLHARGVVKKLLTFARKVPAKRTAVDLNTIVLDGISFLEARCAKEKIELRMDLAPEAPIVVADPPQLKQVFINLAVNAIQAMPGGGRLGITTASGEEQVRLMVEDTGIGMTDEVKDRIFIPFFTTKDVGQGTGLGLSVVHGIVMSHGGAIHVHSLAGRGSRFEVLLPVGTSDQEEEVP